MVRIGAMRSIKKKKVLLVRRSRFGLQTNSGLNARFYCTWFDDVEKKYAKIH